MARRKQIPEEDTVVPVTYAMKAEAEFLPALECLSLMESIRGSLPEGDDEAPDYLVYMVTKMPGLYSTFMGRILSGSSFKSAALATGQSPRTLSRWLEKGSADVADERDTFCARFLMDCQRAYAASVGSAEERVHRKNPEAWLAKSHARNFHLNRYWQDKTQIPEEETYDPLDPPPARPLLEQETEQNEVDKELSEALKVLESHNIIGQPEFVQQAREQFRVKND